MMRRLQQPWLRATITLPQTASMMSSDTMRQIHKYPRTPHLPGSRLQTGDEDLTLLELAEIENRHVVIEEKLDGSNIGISFSSGGDLLIQSRGHVLSGGPRERQYSMLKAWCEVWRGWLWTVLGTRYVLYGEWVFALHSVFYDDLTHYLFEFDILDRDQEVFLSTPARREMLSGGPMRSVPVLYAGPYPGVKALSAMVRPSVFRTTDWRVARRQAAADAGMDPDLLASQTDNSDLAEGLYIKIEAGGLTTGRAKWVRQDFTSRIVAVGTHWNERPLVPNRLRPGVNLFSDA